MLPAAVRSDAGFRAGSSVQPLVLRPQDRCPAPQPGAAAPAAPPARPQDRGPSEAGAAAAPAPPPRPQDRPAPQAGAAPAPAPAQAPPLRPPDPPEVGPAAAARPLRPRRRRVGFGARIVLLLVLFGLSAVVLDVVGRPISLPVWAVAEVEARLNRALADALPDGALSVGGIEITLGDDWVPHLVLEDLRLLQSGGQTLLTLPETYLNLDPSGLLEGQVRAQSLRIVGARIAIRRDRDGHFDLALGQGHGPKIDSLAALFATLDHAFALPALTHLHTVQAEALTLSLTDLRAGKTWEVGDGHLTLENRDTDLAAQLSLTLVAGGSTPAQAVFTAIAAKGAGTARVSAQVDRVAARDLAAQTPLLSWLGVLDAPISGRIAAVIDVHGITSLDGRLDIAAGALQPSAKTTPIPFDHASLGLGYDPDAGRILLTDLSVQSRTLRLTTKGQAYMVNEAGQTIAGALSGRRPAAFLGQIEVSDLSVDPEGLFQAPVQFSQGAVDVRLRLDPFTLDIGQLSLSDHGEHLGLSGQIAADADGWRAAIDLTLNQISRDRLLALWPLRLVSGTRSWVANNIRNADLSDLRASVRIAPGTEPRAELSYDFTNAQLQFMQKMPPVTGADGYATIQGKTYTLVMSRGQVTPPQGGSLDISGSVFAVPDITKIPAVANIDFHMTGPLTATLSLLDQPPFLYLQKAGEPVDLGTGAATVSAQVSFPLKGRVMPWDVAFKVAAEVKDFASDKLVKNHLVTAPLLKIAANPKGMTIAGKGAIGKVPFDGTLAQDFPVQVPTPQELAAQDVVPQGVLITPPAIAAPPGVVTGQATLSQDAVTEFGLGLPRGMVAGQAQADVTLTLPKGAPGRLHLTSNLVGMTVAIPDLGYKKPAGTAGKLDAEVRLGTPPEVTSLAISGAGLQAHGQVSLRANGALDVARFDKITLGGWLDGAVAITGRGTGVPVGLAVTSGTIDLRKFPQNHSGSAASAGSPLSVTLQALRVTEGIQINGFAGDFSLKGGFNGTFTGSVNGAAPITGSAVPTRNGTAVRIQSSDAGQTMNAAGLFSEAHGGSLDMTLIPRAAVGEYDGQATIRHIRVKYGSVMADLLSAISVIGLLDQLNGDGIVFDHAESEFLITPNAIDVQKGSAIGVSMGVSMEGLYHSDTTQLDMRGVVSPVYLLNQVGSILTRKGEGLFGFAYTLRGTADKPDVGVNPLSILTPGMFRDLFRAPAPTLAPDGSGG